MRLTPFRLLLAVSTLVLAASGLGAQQQQHGRGYKPPPATAPVVITVEKAANGKPMPNAAVIFRARHNEQDAGNLEMKTDPDGKASIDLLEVGSRVTVQVIANGYATYAGDFDLGSEGKQILVKLQRPRAQVSTYDDGKDRAAQVQPGVQEHHAQAPTAAPPTPASPTAPLQTVPPANTPATMPGPNSTPAAPGTPQ